MAKKILAFSAGKINGNTETYIKIALEEARKMGCEVELIRFCDVDLRPCKSCSRMPCMVKGPAGCIIKDDAAWLMEKYLEADGIIIGSPMWALAPAGVISDFRDRLFGPKTDVAGWELNGGAPEWVHGRTGHRPGALISVGGALTENWTSLGLPTLYTVTFSNQINIIDHLDVHAVAEPGESLTRQDYVLRAKYLGQNLAYAVNHPEINWEKKFLGKVDGEACPGCHHSVMIAKPGRSYVECAVCGRVGNVSMPDGKLKFEWPEDPGDRLTVQGKFAHMREIEHHAEDLFAPLKDSITEKYDYYKSLSFTVKPPKKQ